MERGLWSFIGGTEVTPEQGGQAAAVNAYRLRSDKAYSLIALSVNTRLQVHISATTDPREAWEILKQQFKFVSITQIVRLNRKFYAASMPEGANLMEHVTTMTSLAEQLREMKEDISSKKFATVILGSLPQSYDGFISSLSARTSDELDWDKIKGLLVEEYMKQKERSEQQSSISNDALFTRRGFHSRRGRPKDRQYGNSARPDSDHLEESKGRGPKCYRCKRFGHIAKQCQQDKKFDESNVAVDCQKANEGSVAQDNIALSSTMKCALSNGWHVDSGATSHMTYDRKNLSNFREFQHPSQVYLGDDKAIFATGQGSVKIACYDESYPITLTLENVLYVPKLRENLLSVAAIAKKGA